MMKPITSLSQLVTQTWLSLTPYTLSVIIYFLVRSYGFFGNQWISIGLKCLPIWLLVAFIKFKGFKWTAEYQFQKRILIGLLFSSVGDIFLDYGASLEQDNGEFFPLGMLAFAVAQVFYISAFGWKPLRIFIGLALYGFGGFAISMMFSNFDAIMKFGVPFYGSLLLTMTWRANARITNNNLPRILAGLGAFSFVISDSFIAFDLFYTPIKYSKIIIMVTYYFAQLGIALSIVDHEVAAKSSSKSK